MFVWFFACISVGTCAADADPEVTLADGSLVEGKIVKLGPIFGKKQILHQFLGVPFAKPPVGW